MRVLYFSRDYTPHDHRFLSAIAANGNETHFLRLERRARQTEDRALPEGVELAPWQRGGDPGLLPERFRWIDLPARALALRRLLVYLEPDVVHAGPIQTCAYIAALAGANPLVSMSWGSDLLVDAHKNGWMKNITRYTLRRSDALLGDCQAVQDAAQGFGFPPERVTLFPWGVDLEKFRSAGQPSELRRRLGWEDAFVVLSLRAWEPIYGVDVLVRAFAHAAAEDPRLRLILLGSGSLAGQIQGLLTRHGLHERVHLGGHISQTELPRYEAAADLYVSASHSDGTSVSLLEALASGLPALVSDIPGNREWIEPGVQGWLFADGDENALAEGLLRAARAGTGLAAMRFQARKLAEARADWSQNVQKLLEVYRQVSH
jgi:glycosyltransferase involved in cell wall biosynthesis